MVKFCPLHKIGFQSDFDPMCPQCTLAALTPPEEWAVDQNTGEVEIPAGEPDKTPINIRTRK